MTACEKLWPMDGKDGRRVRTSFTSLFAALRFAVQNEVVASLRTRTYQVVTLVHYAGVRDALLTLRQLTAVLPGSVQICSLWPLEIICRPTILVASRSAR